MGGGVVLFMLWLAWANSFLLNSEDAIWRSNAFMGLFFFNCGIYLRLWKPVFRLSLVGGILLFAIGICLFAASRLLGGTWYIPISAIAIPLTLIPVWFLVPSCSFSHKIVSCSFASYLLHWMILLAVNSVKNLMPILSLNSGVLELLFKALFAFGVSICMALSLRRFTPKLADVLFGGRC